MKMRFYLALGLIVFLSACGKSPMLDLRQSSRPTSQGSSNEVSAGERKKSGPLSGFGLQEVEYTTSSGEVISAKAYLEPATTPSKIGVLLYFASEGFLDYDWIFPALKEISKKKGLLVVALKTKASQSWTQASAFRNELRAFLKDKISGTYTIDDSRIFVAGAGAGADFVLSQISLNSDWNLFSQAILLCGAGEKQPASVAAVSSSTSIINVFSSTDKNSALRTQILAQLSNAGVKVKTIDPQVAGRCAFDVSSTLSQIANTHL